MIAILVTLVVTGIATLIANRWYQSFSAQFPSKEEILQDLIPQVDSYELMLEEFTNIEAMEEYCLSIGYDYKPPTADTIGMCVYNEQTCNAFSNIDWKQCIPRGYEFPNGAKCNEKCINYTIDAEGNECTKKCTRDANGVIISCEDGCYHANEDTKELCTECVFYDDKGDIIPDKTCDAQQLYLLEQCTYNAKGVDSDKNECDPNMPVYLEWHQDKCVNTEYNNLIRREVCQKLGLEWDQGSVICDTDGICTIEREPTCKIDPDSCRKYGLDWNSSTQDCVMDEWQAYLEVLFGTTITRVYKQRIKDLIDSCKEAPVSYKCIKSSIMLVYNAAATEIVGKTAIKAAQDYLENMKKHCDINTYSSFASSVKCYHSVIFPQMPLLETGFRMISNILVGSLDLIIPGSFVNFVRQAVYNIKKYGAIALEYIIRAGETAIKVLWMGKDLVVSYLSSTLIFAPLAAVIDISVNILKFGISFLRIAFATGMRLLAVLAMKLTEAVVKVFSVVLDMVLNPEVFFQKVLDQAIRLVTDPIGLLKDIFNAMIDLGTWILDLVKIAFKAFKDFAIAAFGELVDFFNSIANTLNTIINKITGVISSIGKSIKKFFGRWF